AHSAGVLHRDLKPDNIMLTEVTGTGDLVKILDFGFAHIVDSADPSLTDKHIVAGTPSYMSPEQSAGQKTDLRTDLYSAAVILYQLSVGKKPFWAQDVMQILSMHIHKPPPRPREVAPIKGISEGLESVILRGLAKSREDRYVDAAQFLEALDGTPEGEEASRPKLSLARTGPAAGVPALPVDKLVERASEERTTDRLRPGEKRGGGRGRREKGAGGAWPASFCSLAVSLPAASWRAITWAPASQKTRSPNRRRRATRRSRSTRRPSPNRTTPSRRRSWSKTTSTRASHRNCSSRAHKPSSSWPRESGSRPKGFSWPKSARTRSRRGCTRI